MVRYQYEQRTGHFIGPDGKIIVTGYSGIDKGLKNPDMEAVKGVGPIPRGMWNICLSPITTKGPLTLILTPIAHDAHGRSEFRIHGDNRLMNHTASHGCIILPRAVRQAIVDGDITALEVVP